MKTLLKRILISIMSVLLITSSIFATEILSVTYAEDDENTEDLGVDVEEGTINPPTVNQDGSIVMSGEWRCRKSSFDDKVTFNTFTLNSYQRFTIEAIGQIERSSDGCTSSNTFYVTDNGNEIKWLEGYKKKGEPLIRYLTIGTNDKGSTRDNVKYIAQEGTHDLGIIMRHIKHPGEGSGALNSYSITFKGIIESFTRLHFDINGGSGSVPADVDIGEVYGTDIGSETPSRIGYDFRGWGANPSWCNSRFSYASTGTPRNKGAGGPTSAITSSSWTTSNYAEALGVSSLGNERTIPNLCHFIKNG